MASRNRIWLFALAGALVASVGTRFAVHAEKAVDTVAAAPLSVEALRGDIVLGRADAPVSMLALVSLTCPHCARWEETEMPVVERELVETGKLRLVIRDLPLNAPALEAAAMLRCAPPEDRLGLHRALLSNLGDWAGKGRDALAASAGLSGDVAVEAIACAGDKHVQEAVLAPAAAAMRDYGVKGTPTFVIGPHIVSGVVPAADIVKMVEDAQAAGR